LHPNVISSNSKVGNPEIIEMGTLAILEAHNVLCKPLIEVRFEAKLYTLSKNFQQYAARHLHASKSGQFLIFNGQKSN
jgi:hypothetical protein